MTVEEISNEDFLKALYEILSFDDTKYNSDYFFNIIKEEMKKPKRKRDYPLIHECYLTLSECFGFEYNNEFEALSDKQISRNRILNDIERKLHKVSTAVL